MFALCAYAVRGLLYEVSQFVESREQALGIDHTWDRVTGAEVTATLVHDGGKLVERDVGKEGGRGGDVRWGRRDVRR